MRGQLLSLDLLFSVVLLTFAIGLSAQYNEAIQKSLAASTQSSNVAEVIAAAILGEGTLELPNDGGFCAEYFDENHNEITDLEVEDCSAFACPSALTYATTRLTTCTGSACALVVKTCG